MPCTGYLPDQRLPNPGKAPPQKDTYLASRSSSSRCRRSSSSCLRRSSSALQVVGYNTSQWVVLLASRWAPSRRPAPSAASAARARPCKQAQAQCKTQHIQLPLCSDGQAGVPPAASAAPPRPCKQVHEQPEVKTLLGLWLPLCSFVVRAGQPPTACFSRCQWRSHLPWQTGIPGGVLSPSLEAHP